MINRDGAPIPGVEFGVNFETMTGYGDAPMPHVEFDADDEPLESPGDIPMTEAVFEVEPDAQSEHIFAVTGIRPDSRYHIPEDETRQMIAEVQENNPSAAERLIATKIAYVYRHIQRSEEASSRDDLTVADVLDMACLAIIKAGVSIDLNNVDAMLGTRLSASSSKKLDQSLADSKLAKGFSVDVTDEEDQLSEIAADESSGSEVEGAVMSQDTREQLLGDLSWRQRYVLERRFALDDTPELSLAEIGEEFGLTGARIHQIENEALREIRLEHGKRNPRRHRVVREEFYDTWMPER